jgi:hypothetical protein
MIAQAFQLFKIVKWTFIIAMGSSYDLVDE